MKRVLLTGASGFIGRHCIEPLLQVADEVHAVSTQHDPIPMPGVVWHQVDLLHPGSGDSLVRLVQPTHLLHLAWYAKPGKYWTATENLAWVEASLALVRAFVDVGGQRLVAAGTCAEYQWGSSDVCSETLTPLLPATLYGTSKHALQTVLAAYAKQCGLSFAWGRIFSLYGPHEYSTRLVASIIQALLVGEPARCGSGELIRDYLHVADVASAFVSLLASDLDGPVNIGSGTGIALKDLIDKLGVMLQRPDLIQKGALATPASEPLALIADTQRLSQTAWRARFDLDAGLADTVAWWRDRR